MRSSTAPEKFPGWRGSTTASDSIQSASVDNRAARCLVAYAESTQKSSTQGEFGFER